MKDKTHNWIKIADTDLKMAKVSLREKEPLPLIFHLHAAVEKILKAILVEREEIPPKVHSLKILALDTCSLKLEEKQKHLLNLLDKGYINSRYPEDLEYFYEEYNLDSCKGLIKEVEEIIKWLKSLINNN